jgi:hypothetical protein
LLTDIEKNADFDPEIMAEKKDSTIINGGIVWKLLNKLRCRNSKLCRSEKNGVSKTYLFSHKLE